MYLKCMRSWYFSTLFYGRLRSARCSIVGFSPHADIHSVLPTCSSSRMESVLQLKEKRKANMEKAEMCHEKK